jgi:CRISPR-associated protein Csb1
MIQNFTLQELTKLVDEDAVAIRGRAMLEPAGGPGDKVFPPSHSVSDRETRDGAKYAFETRRWKGDDVRCVLIDSVQSQANRMEEALQALWTDRKLTLPVIEVDLSSAAPDAGKVTSLTAPHRVADALFRSVNENGTEKLFRSSKIGRSFTDVHATRRRCSRCARRGSSSGSGTARARRAAWERSFSARSRRRSSASGRERA